ncbi:sarcolemmal membrane-associated [Fusarium subglutinans]|uniref:Sarcolemmal membrane-associated n=1 Tax=Gibberella subglutinans TaxID=42677 RepID=A0A8H5Q967_GIBSU|nr:sarcolemmal membrane-associated [Fusarium subglutinans]KAF5610959.1 sarcolemmal membrane-associated [Fusarium subglutinans]
MAVPEYRDEVSITLSIADPPPSFSFPTRRIFLSKKNPTIEIGRTSKRNGAFEAAKSNTWFDSPVMSRKHALFTLDADKQKLYVKDTGSLHGTYKNDVRLETNVNHEVASGDKLKFGAFIERPQDKHYPCAMIVRQTYGSINPELRGNSFRVPEDSDIESLISDEDQVSNSYEMLRANKFVPARMATSSLGHGPIDLTMDDQYPLSNVRNGTETFDNCPHILEIHSPKLPEPVSVLGHEFSDLEEEPEEAENVLSPNSMDTDDSDGDISEDCQSVDYAMSSVAGDSIADEEEDFAEHDEFEEEQVHTQEPAPQENGHIEEDTIMASVMSENSEKTPAQLLADPMSIQTRGAPQQLDGTNLTQLDKSHYAWKSDLAPMMSINGTSSLKLPPISEAVFDTYNHETITHSTAEVVGRKHGKYEFFAAREANAAAARAQPQAQPMDPVCQAPVQEHYVLQAGMENKIPVHLEDELQPPTDETQPRASDLVSSGLRYLATPPEHVEFLNTSAEPELDDSSAWAFQESKKSSGVEVTTEATEKVMVQENDTDAVEDGDAQPAEALEAAELAKPVEAAEPAKPVEAAKAAEPVKIPVPESTATKRKADEISQLTPEEEQMCNDRQSRPQAHHREVQTSAMPRHIAALGLPPSKRLRRMAEAVGYVALGGAAVMSVLIATAPAL